MGLYNHEALETGNCCSAFAHLGVSMVVRDEPWVIMIALRYHTHPRLSFKALAHAALKSFKDTVPSVYPTRIRAAVPFIICRNACPFFATLLHDPGSSTGVSRTAFFPSTEMLLRS